MDLRRTSLQRRIVLASRSRVADPFAAYVADGATIASSWSIEDTSTTSNPTVTDSSGRALIEVSAGSSAGSFWFNDDDGILVHPGSLVSGPFEVRARCEAQNSAGTADPALSSGFRIAGIAVHDPDRSNFDYMHIGLGSTATGNRRCEWKNTVANSSAFGAFNFSASGDFLGDLRIVRRASAPQTFDVSFRQPAGGEALWEDSTAFTALQTFDRTAAPMPDALRVGFTVYSNLFVHDIRLLVDEIDMRATSA